MAANGTRLYLVKDGMDLIGLVRARSQAEAIRHCTAGRFGAEVAGQDELIAALGEGMKVEVAGEPAAEPSNA